jgi:hypothetical protein
MLLPGHYRRASTTQDAGDGAAEETRREIADATPGSALTGPR